MKTRIILIAFLSFLQLAHAQVKVYSGGEMLSNGQGTDQQSKAYEMSGPYLLRWLLLDIPPSKAKDPYWKPRTDTDRNPPWISVRVYDSATQQLITTANLDGRENQIAVKQGGNHYLIISSYDDLKWTVWGKEGIIDTNGIRDLRPSDTGGRDANSARDAVIAELQATQSTKLEEKILAAKLVASRSESAQAFQQRWKAYCVSQKW